MRVGWSRKNFNAHLIAEAAQKWALDAPAPTANALAYVAVHGRTRQARYTKQADWDYIQQVCSVVTSASLPSGSSTVPIIGNGDVFSYTDWERNLMISEEKMQMAKLLLGRQRAFSLAALSSNHGFLPRSKKGRHWDISASERLDILKSFAKYGLEHWGSDPTGVARCRRFLLEWLSFMYRYVPVGLL